MSIREEEERRKKSTNRGLGLAAAAIGVGVGAALYYLFTKREEQPSAEGSTSGAWTCEAPLDTGDILKPLTMDVSCDSDSEYSTISEHSTTDTSIVDVSEDLSENVSEDVSDNVSDNVSDDSDCMTIEVIDESDADMAIDDIQSETDVSDDSFTDYTRTISGIVPTSSGSEYDPSEWEVTTNSLDISPDPFLNQSPAFNFIRSLLLYNSSGDRRRQVTRARTWSLEECSICCDIMLKDQELTSLPCTHRFHKSCIQPWLQMDEQQTCPNCRKQAA